MNQIKIQRLSNDSLRKVLRKGKGIELVLGGVWYYKDEHGSFHRVVNENIDDEFRVFCSMCSEFGYMYLFREKPNFSYTKECHFFDQERINKYKKS